MPSSLSNNKLKNYLVLVLLISFWKTSFSQEGHYLGKNYSSLPKMGFNVLLTNNYSSTTSPYIAKRKIRYKRKRSKDRYSFGSYRSVSYRGNQVISVYQPGTNIDRIYHINSEGNTVFIHDGTTALENLNHFGKPRNSLNPHGAETFCEAVGAGLLYSLFGEDSYKMRSAFDQ